MSEDDDDGDLPGQGMDDGLTPEQLSAIRREMFMDALTVARHDHDPCSQWDEFRDAAWKETALAFGFVERKQPRSLDDQQAPSGRGSERHSDRNDPS